MNDLPKDLVKFIDFYTDYGFITIISKNYSKALDSLLTTTYALYGNDDCYYEPRLITTFHKGKLYAYV